MFKCLTIGGCAHAFRWVPLLVVLGLLLGRESRAHASDNDAFVQFSWVRGPSAQSCPTQDEVAQLVRLRLGRDPFALSATRIIEASIERSGSVWHVELRQRDASGPMQGQRVFDIPENSCAQVADAVALALEAS